MKHLYLVTGGTGHLGSEILVQLLKRDQAHIRTLVLPDDPADLPDGVEKVEGDVTDRDSLIPFFNKQGYDRVSLIHNAAMITIESKANQKMREVNIDGVDNICQLALETGIDRMVHVSSVHAIPEGEKGATIKETKDFDPDLVVGQYAKSKAIASDLVLDYAEKGLPVSIVHPSGIIGIGYTDTDSYMMQTIAGMATKKIPVSIEGGYDFVDVKDVAGGVLRCLDKGRQGEPYILSGHYVTIDEISNIITDYLDKPSHWFTVPHSLAEFFAPLGERIALAFKQKPIYTPYAMYTLTSNADFDHSKATAELDYHPRPIEDTIKEILVAYDFLDA